MPRTFSLGRLMLVVTVAAVLCGFAVNFPQVAAVFGFFVPTVVSTCVFVALSSHRRVMLGTAIYGALVGLFVLASIMTPSISPIYASMFPTVGVILLGSARLLDERLQRRRR